MTSFVVPLLAAWLFAWPAGTDRGVPEGISNEYFEALELLRHKKKNYRQRGALVLKEVGDRRAAPYLAAALTDPDAIVRRRAAEALADLGEYDDRVTVSRLADSLAGEVDDDAYLAKILTLAHFSGHKETGIQLLTTFQALEPGPQARLLFFLNDLIERNLAGFDNFRDVFTEALKSGNRRAAALAITAFGKHGTAADLELIKGSANAADLETRLTAIRFLGRYQDEDIEGILRRASSDDPLPLVRAEALEALGRYRKADLIYEFVRATADIDPQVRQAGAVGLGILRDDTTRSVLQGLLTDVDLEVRLEAAHSLALMKRFEGYDILVWEARENPDRLLRRIAAHGLLALNTRHAATHFQSILRMDRDPVVREFCILGLQKQGYRVER